MPDEIAYDETRQRLLIGTGFIDNVPPAVWNYEVSGKRVLTQWFSYRNSTDLTEEDRKELERLLAHEKKVRPHLISRYEFILAGALDVHPLARKSLSWGNKTTTPAKPGQPVERNLFSDLEDDAASNPKDQQPTQDDADEDESAENLP